MELFSTTSTLARMKDIIDAIRQVSERFHLVSMERALTATQRLLANNPPIDVAVLGQFKAGKSSLLNSLVGQNVLPVGVIPVTTAVTRLQFGKSEHIAVRHYDGSSTSAPLADIAEFTSEAKNPDNLKKVAIVDIELPTLKKYAGLRLVDTPGLGSIYKYHQSASENWLPEVGTALLAISSDRPLSENDLALIGELTAHTPNIIILLTKADLLSSEQQVEVLEFFRKALRKALDRELPVYLFSTRHETALFKENIEQELLKMGANRDVEFFRILRHKTVFLVQGALRYLNIALNTSLQADLNRDTLRNRIINEKINQSLIREELNAMAREHQRRTRPFIQSRLERFQGPLVKKIKIALETELPAWEGNLWQLARRYETWMSNTMSEEMSHLSRTESRDFQDVVKNAQDGFSRALDIFRRLLNANIQQVLGLELADVKWEIELPHPEQPDIAFVHSFDTPLDSIWFLIPMKFFRKQVDGHFLNGVRRQVEINLSRLAYQWEKRIHHAIDSMRDQSVTYVQTEIATIEGLLSQTQGETDDIRRWIAELENMAKQLHS